MRKKIRLSSNEFYKEKYISSSFFGNDYDNYIFLYSENISDVELNLYLDKNEFKLIKGDEGNKFYQSSDKNSFLYLFYENGKIKKQIKIVDEVADFKYSFLLKSNSNIELKEDRGKINIYKGNDLICSLSPLSIIDNKKILNFDICYEIQKINDNEYLLNVVSKENFSVEKLNFPIIIDPEISNNSNIVDVQCVMYELFSEYSEYTSGLFLGFYFESYELRLESNINLNNLANYLNIPKSRIKSIELVLTSADTLIDSVCFNINNGSTYYNAIINSDSYSIIYDSTNVNFSSISNIFSEIICDEEDCYEYDTIGNYSIYVEVVDLLTDISVFSLPLKTEYQVGETFDPTGLVVYAHHESGEITEVTSYSINVPSFVLGENNISISYTEDNISKTTTFSIYVVENFFTNINVLEISKPINGYLIGTLLSSDDFVVNAGYDSNPLNQIIINNFTILNNHPLNEGSNNLTIKFIYNNHNYYKNVNITLDKSYSYNGDLAIETTAICYFYYNEESLSESINQYDFGYVEGDYYYERLEIKFDPTQQINQLINEKNPITLLIQSLRIYINGELDEIEIYDLNLNLIGEYQLTIIDDNFGYVDIPFNLLPQNGNLYDFIIFSESTTYPCYIKPEQIFLHYEFNKTLATHIKRDNINVNSSTRYGSNPNVNLANGSLFYNLIDLPLYKGNFSFNLEHIYNSNCIELFENKKIHKGKGFKLNVEEFVDYYEENNKQYIVYNDANGYSLRFKKAVNGTRQSNNYYDEIGYGFKIVYPYAYNNKTYYLLEDDKGNKKVFNDRGKIIYYIDSHDYLENVFLGSGFALKLDYNYNGELVRIYNTELYQNGSGEYLNFVYEDNLLSRIEHYKNSQILKSIYYEYDIASHLVAVYKREISQPTKTSSFEYNYFDYIKLVSDTESKLAYQLFCNEYLEVNRIENGYIDNNNFNILDYVNFTYSYVVLNGISYSNKTLIESKSGITYEFDIDLNGKIVSSFQKPYFLSEHLYPENKRINKILQVDTTSELKINDLGIANSTSTLLRSYASLNIYGDGEEGAKTFTINFFLRLNSNYSDDTLYLVLFFDDGSIKHFRSKINENAYKVWQFTGVNFRIETNEEEVPLNNFRLYLVSLNNNPIDCDFSYFQIQSCSYSKVYINNYGDIDEKTGISFVSSSGLRSDINRCKDVSFNLGNGVNKTIYLPYKQYSISLDDLMYVALVSYKSSNDIPKFASFNNKKYVYENLNSFTLNSGYIDRSYVYNGDFNYHVVQYNLSNDYRTLFRINFNDNKISSTTVHLKDGGDSASSIHVESMNGDIISDRDIYGIEYKNYYDNYGNLIERRKNKYSSNSTIDKYQVLEINTFDNNSEKIEINQSETIKNKFEYDNFSNIIKNRSFDYDEDNDTHVLANDYLKVQYDNYGEKILSYAIENGNTIYYQNDIEYQDGKISAIRNGYEDIAIDYDIANNKVIYSHIDSNNIKTNLQEIEKETLSDYSTLIKNKIYLGNETYTLVVKQNKFGKTINSYDGTYYAKFIYVENYKGFLGSEPIYQVTDFRTGLDYLYSYNDKAELVRLRQRYGGNYQNYLDIRQTSSQETTYLFKDFYKLKIGYVNDEILTSNRLKEIIYSWATGNVTANTNSYCSNPISFSYVYDDFNRLVNYDLKQTQPSSCIQNNILVYKDFSTNKMSSRLATFTCNYDENLFYKITYNYANNQISSITTKIAYYFYYLIQISYFNLNKNYLYDEIGRIIQEHSCDANNVETIINIIYGNDKEISNFGKIAQVNVNNVSKVFNYSLAGHLSSITIGNNTYLYARDNYGNCITYSNQDSTFNLTYIKGNLLSNLSNSAVNISYGYTYNNVRYSKTVTKQNTTLITKYFYDNDKLLGEERSDGQVIIYLYNDSGIFGFSLRTNTAFINYYFIKDAEDNVVALQSSNKEIIAFYTYDIFGNCKIYDDRFQIDNSVNTPQKINPIRWKSKYFDVESGFYYIGGRYYSPFTSEYLEGSDLEGIENHPEDFFILRRNGIHSANPSSVGMNSYSFLTVLEFKPDPAFDPSLGVSWWQQNSLKILLIAVNLALSIVQIICSPVSAVIGIVGSILSFVSLFINEVFGGASSVFVTGLNALFAAFRCLQQLTNPIYFALGILGIASGLICCTFGAAEFGESFGYGNFIKNLGISDEIYNTIKTTATICAIAVTILGPKCFKKGTLIKTKDGDRPIEEIKEGDEVLSFNEVTKQNEYQKVTRLFRGKTNIWVHIILDNDEEIICTPQHKFYEKDKGWIESRRLVEKSKILKFNGLESSVKRTIIKHETYENTYNFEVNCFHNYYLSNGILTHNRCSSFDDDEPISPKKVTNYELKKYGIDAHEFKKIHLKGQKDQVLKHYNIYKDIKRKNLLYLIKNKSNLYINTGEYLK